MQSRSLRQAANQTVNLRGNEERNKITQFLLGRLLGLRHFPVHSIVNNKKQKTKKSETRMTAFEPLMCLDLIVQSNRRWPLRQLFSVTETSRCLPRTPKYAFTVPGILTACTRITPTARFFFTRRPQSSWKWNSGIFSSRVPVLPAGKLSSKFSKTNFTFQDLDPYHWNHRFFACPNLILKPSGCVCHTTKNEDT